ncbi:hypothetical protein GXP67_07070 [Rhodocytophaga rosea]|uniref:Uncharacterized protein n=1 Tax=Rhodocytophaga rosea TaxID=2704465 RepID=A0A6C0GEM7_9BACT|nr:hypothetical protein [Rhodocytophaga rosea]QHT66435.1 hypothetical protein GXP67_07070 [Rhodocytophaga rosea]
MKTLLLLFLNLFACSCFAQIQILYFNSTSNIVRLEFSTFFSSLFYTGIGSGANIGEGIAHAETGRELLSYSGFTYSGTVSVLF